MSNEEFYSSTINELNLRIEEYNRKLKQDMEANRISMSFAIASALKGKDIRIFKDESNDNEQRTVTKEEKVRELNELKSIFEKR